MIIGFSFNSLWKYFVSVLDGINKIIFFPLWYSSIALSINSFIFENGGFTKFFSFHSVVSPSVPFGGHGS